MSGGGRARGRGRQGEPVRALGVAELRLRWQAGFENLHDSLGRHERWRWPAWLIGPAARLGATVVLPLLGPQQFVLQAPAGRASAIVDSRSSVLITLLWGCGYALAAWALGSPAARLADGTGTTWGAGLGLALSLCALVPAALAFVQFCAGGFVAWRWWRFPGPIEQHVHDLVRWRHGARRGCRGAGAALQEALNARFPGLGLDAANEQLVEKVYGPLGMRAAAPGRPLSLVPGAARARMSDCAEEPQ